MPLHLDSLDTRAEFAELFVDHLVPAIDVVDAIDFGRPVGQQSRENQVPPMLGDRSPSPAHRSSFYAANLRHCAIQFNCCSHSF